MGDANGCIQYSDQAGFLMKLTQTFANSRGVSGEKFQLSRKFILF